MPWEHIWTLRCEELGKIMKLRAPMTKKLNYEEKIVSEFSPYQAVEKLGEIEDMLWHNGDGNMRSAAAYLRHRYVLNHTTCGIL